MEKNIFEGAKFADKFLCKDGRVVSLYKINNNFTRESRHYAVLMLEPNNDMIQGPHNYNMDGTAQDNHSFLDIVSRYKEPIDEEKLDELAEESCRDNNFYHGSREYLSTEAYIIGYKEGYRKAKRNKI